MPHSICDAAPFNTRARRSFQYVRAPLLATLARARSFQYVRARRSFQYARARRSARPSLGPRGGIRRAPNGVRPRRRRAPPGPIEGGFGRVGGME